MTDIFDEQIERVKLTIEHAENALMDSGFSPDQWEMIKDYISNSIALHHLVVAKGAADPLR